MSENKAIDKANLELALSENNAKLQKYMIRNINVAQKTMIEKLDYCCLQITADSNINLSAGTVIPFNTVAASNMECNTDTCSVKLKGGRTYKISADFIVSGGMTTNSIHDITNNICINAFVKNHPSSSEIKTTDSSGSVIYQPENDCEIQIKSTWIAGTPVITTSNLWGYFIVEEISRQVVIDPVEHINNVSGVEDTPVGHVIAHMGTMAPKHYLICDGGEYNIAEYPYLAQHIQDNFGSVNYFGGDGIGTFAIPDLRERFLKGSDKSGEFQEAGLPNITADWISEPSNSAKGAVWVTSEKGTVQPVSSGGSKDSRVHFDASRSSPIYGRSDTVIPKNISVLYCIKCEPTYCAVVKRETNQEDINAMTEQNELLTQQVTELQKQNILLQQEITYMEIIIEKMNRTEEEVINNE